MEYKLLEKQDIELMEAVLTDDYDKYLDKNV